MKKSFSIYIEKVNNCLNCCKPAKNKYCSISCQNYHQSHIRVEKRYGKLMHFEVGCKSCNKSFLVEEREKSFPKKENHYCSKSCANKREHNQETKDKIKKTLKGKTAKTKTFECVICKSFFTHKRKRSSCSEECYNKLRKATVKPHKTYIRKNKDGHNKIFIYALVDEYGAVKYVGKSKDVESRYKKHLKESKRNKTYKEKWVNSMLKRNLKPECFILDECESKDEDFMETFWIAQMKSWGFKLTNGTKGGDGSDGFKGRKHTIETRRQISEKNRLSYKSGKRKQMSINYETNQRIKLKENDILYIRNTYNGENLNELAFKFKVNKSYLRTIINNKRRLLK